jgi:hypothetical protein
MDPDPDPAIFILDLQDANRKLYFLKSFSADYFLEVPVHLNIFKKFLDKKKS